MSCNLKIFNTLLLDLPIGVLFLLRNMNGKTPCYTNALHVHYREKPRNMSEFQLLHKAAVWGKNSSHCMTLTIIHAPHQNTVEKSKGFVPPKLAWMLQILLDKDAFNAGSMSRKSTMVK